MFRIQILNNLRLREIESGRRKANFQATHPRDYMVIMQISI